MITSSTSPLLTLALFNTSLITTLPSSDAFNLESDPLKQPIILIYQITHIEEDSFEYRITNCCTRGGYNIHVSSVNHFSNFSFKTIKTLNLESANKWEQA